MRLGISQWNSHSSGEEWARKIKELACSAVVFPLSSDDTEDKIIEYKNAAENNGLMIAEVGIWRNTMSPDADERKANIDYAVNQFRLADFLNARCAVNVAGAIGSIWDGGYRENYTKETWKQIVSTVQEIIDRANVKNTYFSLEPMPWMYPTSPKEYVKLLEEVERDRFAVHMDIINMINSADRYFKPEEFLEECADLLKGKIRSCHIKDIHFIQKYTFMVEECAPGEGEFPIRKYVSKMNDLDSEMPMILEHLKSDDEYVKYMGYLKEELNGLYKSI